MVNVKCGVLNHNLAAAGHNDDLPGRNKKAVLVICVQTFSIGDSEVAIWMVDESLLYSWSAKDIDLGKSRIP